jgi:hypothetical protein
MRRYTPDIDRELEIAERLVKWVLVLATAGCIAGAIYVGWLLAN